MYLPVTSKVYLCVPIDGPDSAGDLTQYAARIALVPDNGTEPAPGDWHSATWIEGEAAILIGPGAVTYPSGAYVVWATISAGAEAPVLPSGRVRIGDIRA